MRIADFDVDGVVIGDGRAWSTAQWDLMTTSDLGDVRRAVAANPSTSDRYVIAMSPFLDEFATTLKELSASSG